MVAGLPDSAVLDRADRLRGYSPDDHDARRAAFVRSMGNQSMPGPDRGVHP